LAAAARGKKMMTDDPAWALAQHVCHTTYADLPASAVESARRDILDTFGAAETAAERSGGLKPNETHAPSRADY
jgi:2-methylcitrate dehydratase PrpD